MYTIFYLIAARKNDEDFNLNFPILGKIYNRLIKNF